MDYAQFDRVRAVAPGTHFLELLDQRLLPGQILQLRLTTASQVVDAIASLQVRGAPAIGIAGAYGAWLAALEFAEHSDWRTQVRAALLRLRNARPTAVNLAWAVDQQLALLDGAVDAASLVNAFKAKADQIRADDLAANHLMGRLGAELIAQGSSVLTHCNTGSLATAGFGTALGVVRAAFAEGRIKETYAAETRPWLQGARLTAWELLQDAIPARLVADGAGALLFSSGRAHWLIVGADRIARNGDTANKIGTLAHACAAKQFGAKVMVVAPFSTVDMDCKDGASIHIEERSEDELLSYGGVRTVAEGVRAFNPVFDVTPAHLIDAIVTERGVVQGDFSRGLKLLGSTA
jgi:methylthioribose-1-phosphate isomerase